MKKISNIPLKDAFKNGYIEPGFYMFDKDPMVSRSISHDSIEDRYVGPGDTKTSKNVLLDGKFSLEDLRLIVNFLENNQE